MTANQSKQQTRMASSREAPGKKTVCVMQMLIISIVFLQEWKEMMKATSRKFD